MAPNKQGNKHSNFLIKVSGSSIFSEFSEFEAVKKKIIQKVDSLYLATVQAIPSTKICYSNYEKGTGRFDIAFFFKIKVRNRESWMVNQLSSFSEELSIDAKKITDLEFSARGFNNLSFSRLIQCYETEEDSDIKWKRELIESVTVIHNYEGGDIAFLDDRSTWHKWQIVLWSWFFDSNNQVKPYDDRVIYHIVDPVGMTGKSKFIKWISWNHLTTCTKLTYAKSHQIKQSVLDSNAKLFLIDLPRTKGREENPRDLASSIEEIKSGHITSCMYGKPGLNFSDPPHVVFFSNSFLSPKLFSPDRWKIYLIDPWDKSLVAIDMLKKDEQYVNVAWPTLLPPDHFSKLKAMKKSHPLYRNWTSAMENVRFKLEEERIKKEKEDALKARQEQMMKKLDYTKDSIKT